MSYISLTFFSLALVVSFRPSHQTLQLQFDKPSYPAAGVPFAQSDSVAHQPYLDSQSDEKLGGHAQGEELGSPTGVSLRQPNQISQIHLGGLLSTGQGKVSDDIPLLPSSTLRLPVTQPPHLYNGDQDTFRTVELVPGGSDRHDQPGQFRLTNPITTQGFPQSSSTQGFADSGLTPGLSQLRLSSGSSQFGRTPALSQSGLTPQTTSNSLQSNVPIPDSQLSKAKVVLGKLSKGDYAGALDEAKSHTYDAGLSAVDYLLRNGSKLINEWLQRTTDARNNLKMSNNDRNGAKNSNVDQNSSSVATNTLAVKPPFLNGHTIIEKNLQ